MRTVRLSILLQKCAQKINNEQLMAEVLRYGNNPNVRTKNGSIFHTALASDTDRVMNYIIDAVKNFDYGATDAQGETVLMKLVHPVNIGIATKLLEKLKKAAQSESNPPDCQYDITKLFKKYKNGDGVLHQCIRQQNNTLLRYLLANKDSFGVNPEELNSDGLTYAELEVA